MSAHKVFSVILCRHDIVRTCERLSWSLISFFFLRLLWGSACFRHCYQIHTRWVTSRKSGTRKKLNNWNFWRYLFNLSAKEQSFCRPISSVSPQRLGICLRLVRVTTHHMFACLRAGWSQGQRSTDTRVIIAFDWVVAKCAAAAAAAGAGHAKQTSSNAKINPDWGGTEIFTSVRRRRLISSTSCPNWGLSSENTAALSDFLCLSSDWNGSTSSTWEIPKKDIKHRISPLFTASCCLFPDLKKDLPRVWKRRFWVFSVSQVSLRCQQSLWCHKGTVKKIVFFPQLLPLNIHWN